MARTIKNCVHCAKRIPITAIKCTNCYTFQNWRRFFTFGNAVIPILSLILAIGSFLFGVRDEIAEYLDPPKADLRFHVEDNDTSISNVSGPPLMATIMNVGKRTALIQGKVSCASYDISFLSFSYTFHSAKIVTPDQVVHIAISTSKDDETDRPPTYADGEHMEDVRKQEVKSIGRRVTDPLGATDEQKELMTEEERSAHEEQVENYYIANRADPDFVLKAARSRALKALSGVECMFPSFPFNKDANVELEPFQTKASEKFIDWLIQYNNPEGS